MLWIRLHEYGTYHRRKLYVNIDRAIYISETLDKNGNRKATYIDFVEDSLDVIETMEEIVTLIAEAQEGSE